MMRLVWLLLLALPAFAQFGSNATKLRGTNLCNPLTLTDASALTWDGTNNCWNTAVTAGVQVTTQPINQRDTCNATIAANTLVKSSGNVIVAATAGAPVLGIARAACVGTGQTTIAMLGSENCIAEGSVSAGNWVIQGSSNPARCMDSGTADISGIPNTTPVVGLARAAGTNGNAFEVTLFGSGQFGLDDGDAGGGSGDFSSNTSTSINGEVVEMSGTGGKTGMRSNRTHAVASITGGIIGGATSAGVIGLWTETCDDTTFLRGDGECATAGGAASISAGIGITATGSGPVVIALDSATQRTFIAGSASASPGTLAANSCAEVTVPVTGAASGDVPQAGLPTNFSAWNVIATAYVSAADTVKIKLCNPTGSSQAITGGLTYNVLVPKAF